MAFQIKDFASIVASCINWMRANTKKVTDYNVGSVTRTLIEAPAVELDEFYMRMYMGLKEAIPVSVYNSFDFSRLPAVAAAGLIRVTVTSSAADVVIHTGTAFTTAGKSGAYVSTLDATITAGNTFVDVPVAYSATGAVGNLAASAAFVVAPSPTGFVSAANPSAFVSGQDEETDEQRKLRFRSYVDSLKRSTIAALVYGMKLGVRKDSAGNEVERVRSAIVIEPYVLDNTQPVGWVKCYVHNGFGSTSAGLVTLVAQILQGYVDSTGASIPGWKAAGVKCDTFAAGDQLLGVTAVLTALPGYVKADLVVAATAAIGAYLSGLEIGEVAIRSEIIGRVMDIDGVYNFTVSAPAGDTTPAATTKLLPGTIAIT